MNLWKTFDLFNTSIGKQRLIFEMYNIKHKIIQANWNLTNFIMLDLQPANNGIKQSGSTSLRVMKLIKFPYGGVMGWLIFWRDPLHQLEVKVEPFAYALISILEDRKLLVIFCITKGTYNYGQLFFYLSGSVSMFPYIFVIPIILALKVHRF